MRTLEERLGYTFQDRKRLEGALYHSSYANEHRSLGIHSNERLEFLGDAVLGLVTADYLFRKHPDLPEGDLTRIRAALVCEESLHEVAQSLDLGSYLKLGKGEEAGGGRQRASILADATESVFAAVYWTAGWRRPVRSFTGSCWIRSGRRMWRSAAGTTRRSCRSWCSGAATRRCNMNWSPPAVRTTPRYSPPVCC